MATPVDTLRAERRALLAQFLRWLVPVVVGFGLLEAGAGWVFAEPVATATALIILGYAAIGGLAALLNRDGRTELASGLLAIAVTLCALVLVWLQPEIHPTLAIVPLLGAVLVYPYVEGGALAAVLIGAAAASAAIEEVGSLLAPTTHLPVDFLIVFRSASTAAVVAFIALFLWQHRSRLRAQLAAAERARDDLEATVVTLRNLERQARSLAFHDAVTHLPNRLLFFDRLERALVSAHRQQRRVAVLFLDLDGFKVINDSFGHDVGDQALESLGQRLQETVREDDTVARYGGDEFTVLLPSIASTLDVERVVHKLAAVLAKPLRIAGEERRLSASAGVALFPDHGDTPQALLRAADMAMYRAKSQGRARYA